MTYEPSSPYVHLDRYGTSVCRPGQKVRISEEPDDVTCTKCRSMTIFRSLMKKRMMADLDAD